MASNPTETHTAMTDKEIQIPEWENAGAAKSGATATGTTAGTPRILKPTFAAKLDRVLPPHRKYLRMRRNVFLIVLVAVFLALLALIIGLAAGLSGHSKKDLPLPSNSQSFTGDFTYYQPGLGACGETNADSDNIVSVSHLLFDAAGSSSSKGGNSNQNPLCNLMLRAQRYYAEIGEMRSVDLKVVDRCTGCAADDLDTTIDAFEKLAPSASGRVDVTWAWLQPAPTG